MIKTFQQFNESEHPIRDWENMSPSEILVALTNWVGAISGDDADFTAGIKHLASKQDDLTTDQKKILMDTIGKMQDVHKNKFAPMFMKELK